MRFWQNKLTQAVPQVLLIVLSIAYPFAMLAAGERVPSFAFAAVACLLLGLRTLYTPAHWSAALRFPILIAMGLIVGLALLDAALAAKAYPVVVSGGLALLFGLSLRQPTSLVERIAGLSGDVLSPSARVYCRRVTVVWTLWLALNAAIAAWLAMAGTLAAWALWTGVISYVVMGLIFSVEFLLRHMLRRRRATG